MNREEIVNILSPLNLWGEMQHFGIRREGYLNYLEKCANAQDVVLAISGVRRSGKTYLSRQFLDLMSKKSSKESTLYVLMEDPKFEPYLKVDLLDEIYQAYRTYINREKFAYIVFDEIQNVHLWEKWVRIMLERKEKVKIIITGSSSKLLTSELATVLTGRTLTLNVFPLEFKEFLSFKSIKLERDYDIITKKEILKDLLLEYFTYGGFPQVVLEKDTFLKQQLLKEIFEGIIYRDAVFRHKIKDAYLIKTIAEVILQNFSSLLSANRLRNFLINTLLRKVSPNYVVDILSYLEESFLIFQLPIFSYKVKEQKQYPRKVYCIDTGLINTVTVKFRENIGRIYENVVAINLLRNDGKENLFYWRSKDNKKEVDFVVKKGVEIKQLIQVCYQLDDERTKKREIDALIKASFELNCPNLFIISDNKEGAEQVNGKKIIYKPLWKWLLEETN